MSIPSVSRYVFPAVGFAAVLTQCSTISDDVFLTAAECLSHLTSLEVRGRAYALGFRP